MKRFLTRDATGGAERLLRYARSLDRDMMSRCLTALLLLGAIAFWWGIVVAPRLFSLAFPARLPPDALPSWTDPNWDGEVTNLVSALTMLAVSLQAGWTCVRLRHPRSKVVSRAGWALVTVTLAMVAYAEVSDVHVRGLQNIAQESFESNPRVASIVSNWVIVLSPLAVVFVAAMGVFLWRGVDDSSARYALMVGVVAWMLVPILEAWQRCSCGPARPGILVEETLEFGGALCFGVAAMMERQRSASVSLLRSSRLKAWVAAAVIVTLGGSLYLAFVLRPPMADTRLTSRIGSFDLHLPAQSSVVQELGVLPIPLSGIDLRMSTNDPLGRAGSAIWRIADAGTGSPQRFLAQGRLTVPAGAWPESVEIRFPAVAEATARSVAIQLVADVASGDGLRIGASNIDRYDRGRLWINGELDWPNHNLEFVLRGAPELTPSKLRTLGSWLTSNWRLPLLLATLGAGLVLTVVIPAVLLAYARCSLQTWTTTRLR